MLHDCPFCHHQQAALFKEHQQLRNGNAQEVFICNECGTLYPRPRMDSSEAMKYHSQLYQSKQIFSAAAPLKQSWNEKDPRTKMILQWMKPQGNALDIGTFTGSNCHFLTHLGFNTFGLEPDVNAVKFAQDNGSQVFQGTFPENMPAHLSQMKYHLICLMEVIYYFIDLQECLKKLSEMLVPGGFLLIKAHQGKSRYYEKNSSPSLFSRYGDYVQGMPTMHSLIYCLEKTGFEVVDVLEIPLFVSFNKEGMFGKPFDFFEKILNKMESLKAKITSKNMTKLAKFPARAKAIRPSSADRLMVLAKNRGWV
ncbi:class I SAM-dependent methyltransferase [Deltaproteobacteria bacterium TL4]